MNNTPQDPHYQTPSNFHNSPQPSNGYPQSPMPPFQPPDPWYKKQSWIIFLLIFFFPLGLFLMWQFSGWQQRTKQITTGVVILIFITGNISNLGSNESKSASNKEAESKETKSTMEAGGTKSNESTPATETTTSEIPTTTSEITTTTVATTTTTTSKLFPQRADSQKEDQERNINEAAKLSGYTTTVTEASYQQSVSSFEKDGYIVISVTVENRDSRTQSYDSYDWKLQTPEGTVIDPDFTTIDGRLESGDLIQNGSTSGKIVFEVGNKKGDYYIIYKPDAFDSARGIWKVTV